MTLDIMGMKQSSDICRQGWGYRTQWVLYPLRDGKFEPHAPLIRLHDAVAFWHFMYRHAST